MAGVLAGALLGLSNPTGSQKNRSNLFFMTFKSVFCVCFEGDASILVVLLQEYLLENEVF